MPLHDMSDVPRAPEGSPPERPPRFADLLALMWRAEGEAEDHTPSGARFRASDAGKCSRAIALKAADIERTDPMGLSGWVAVTMGRILHKEFDRVVEYARLRESDRDQLPPEIAAFAKEARDRLGADPSVEEQYRFDLETGKPNEDGDGVCRFDLLARTARAAAGIEPGDEPAGRWRAIVEVKSIGGWGYKLAIGKQSRSQPAQGPKPEAFLQAAITGLVNEADEVVVVDIAKESLSVKVAGADTPEVERFAAEWRYGRDQFEGPAREEMKRAAGILRVLDAGDIAKRSVPEYGVIANPSTGLTANGGSYWGCDYCDYQELCVQLPTERVPVEQVVKVRTQLAAGVPAEGDF